MEFQSAAGRVVSSWPPPAQGGHHAASGPHRIHPVSSGAPVPATSPTRPVPPGLTVPHCPPAWHPPLCPGSLLIRSSQVVPTGKRPPAQLQGRSTLVSCWQRGGPARDLRPLRRAVTAWWHRHSAAACRAAGPGSTSRSTRSCGCGQEPRTSTGACQPPETLRRRGHTGWRGQGSDPGVACSHGPVWGTDTRAGDHGQGGLGLGSPRPTGLHAGWRGCSHGRAVWGPLMCIWGPAGAPQRHCSD